MNPRDWHGVAEAKVLKILGDREGRVVLAETLESLALDKLASADDLRRFSERLEARGGFASAVAAILNVHVAIHG